MKFFLPFILLLAPQLQASINPEQTQIVFQKANEAYSLGSYSAAQELYQSILDLPYPSGSVHFNLGNTYYRQNQIGQAIFHFRKAQELRPRDADIKYNLQYARAKALDKIETTTNIRSRILFLTKYLSQKEAYYFFFAVFAIFWILSAILIYNRHDYLIWIQRTIGAVGILAAITAIDHVLKDSDFGVITANEAKVYSGTGKDNVILFTLHEGAEFDIVQTHQASWVQIQIADGKKGWIQKKHLIQ